MVIALDVMGGDNTLRVPVEAAVRAAGDFEQKLLLVGDQDRIEKELDRHSYPKGLIEIVHCSETVEMHESPAQALRQKKDSSIRIAVDLLKEGRVEAVVSAGNTGASMATSKFVLKSIPEIERPAIATLMPSVNRDHPFVLLDIGANIDCKPIYLLQFALMGDAYARTLLKLDNPRIALLNNGEEEGKGNLIVQQAYELMERSSLNFVGNIEGKGMFNDEVDIVVCDGFVGNIALKVAEGTFDLIVKVLKQEFELSWLSRLGYLAMRGSLQGLKNRLDYSEVGGAPLLGVNGVVIICHGNSQSRTIRNAIRHAHQCAELKLNDVISSEVTENQTLLKEAEAL